MENTLDNLSDLNEQKARVVTRLIAFNLGANLNDRADVQRLSEIISELEDLTRRINVMIGRLMQSSLSQSEQPRSRTSSMGSPRNQNRSSFS